MSDAATARPSPETGLVASGPFEGRQPGDRPAFRRSVAPALRRWGRPLAIWAASRLVALVVFATGATVAASYGDGLGARPWPAVSSAGSLTVKALAAWDGAWYLDIAEHGYPALEDGSALAFFPGYPLTVRAVARLTGIGYPAAGLAVALGFGALAAVLLWELSRHLGGSRFADRSLFLFAFFPGSFVLSMAYSEPMMLAASLGCLLMLLRQRWLIAGLCGAVATATRPNAVVLVACCAWAAGAAIRGRSGPGRPTQPGPAHPGPAPRRQWAALAAPALAASGLAGYYLYLWAHTGQPLAWFSVQGELWGERLDVSRATWRAAGTFDRWWVGLPQDLNQFLPTAGVGFAVVTGVLMWRWRPPAVLWIYAGGVLFLALTAWNLGPRPRFLLTAFPLLQALAWRLRGTHFVATVAASAVLLACLTFVSVMTTQAVP